MVFRGRMAGEECTLHHMKAMFTSWVTDISILPYTQETPWLFSAICPPGMQKKPEWLLFINAWHEPTSAFLTWGAASASRRSALLPRDPGSQSLPTFCFLPSCAAYLLTDREVWDYRRWEEIPCTEFVARRLSWRNICYLTCSRNTACLHGAVALPVVSCSTGMVVCLRVHLWHVADARKAFGTYD